MQQKLDLQLVEVKRFVGWNVLTTSSNKHDKDTLFLHKNSWGEIQVFICEHELVVLGQQSRFSQINFTL